MILKVSNVPGSIREAELELDFGSKKWAVKNGKAQLPGVVSSDGGSFQQQPWGVIWLLDGASYPAARTNMIIWDAPVNEYDRAHTSGGARLYEPANSALKDNVVKWTYVRSSSGIVTPGGATGELSDLRKAMVEILHKWVPRPVLSSDDDDFKALTGFTTKRLLDEYWEPENAKPAWPEGKMPKKNTTFTTCNLTLGVLAGKLGQKVGKKVGRWLGAGVLQLDWADKDVKGSWIPSSKGGSPKVGDFYSKADGKQVFGHVGTIGEIAADGTWKACDGGQGGYNSGRKHDFIKWVPRGKMVPSELNGWVDIDLYFK